MNCRRRYVSSSIYMLGFFLALSEVAVAQEPVVPKIRTPIEEVREQQTAREKETIEKLRIALNEQLTPSERIAAISSLGGIDYDYLLANADKLVMGDAEVARRAISVIGGQISMLPSPRHHVSHGGADTQSEFGNYQSDLVVQSEAVLTLALDHPDPSVKTKAATTLAPRDSTAALFTLQGMIEKGDINAQQGISYLSLAPSSSAAPFLEKYLTEGEVEARAAAVSQLSYNPNYTSRVREVALKVDTPDEVTTAALRGLAQTDKEFLLYAPAIATDNNRAVETREAALRASLEAVNAIETNEKELIGTVVRSLRQASEGLNTPTAIETYRAFESQQNLFQ